MVDGKALSNCRPYLEAETGVVHLREQRKDSAIRLRAYKVFVTPSSNKLQKAHQGSQLELLTEPPRPGRVSSWVRLPH